MILLKNNIVNLVYFIFLGGNQLPEPQVPSSRSRFFKPISLSPTASSTPNSSHRVFNPDPAMGSPDLHPAADPSLTPYDDLDELSRLDRVGPALDQNDHPGKLKKCLFFFFINMFQCIIIYFKLNSDKTKSHKAILWCGFLSCDSDYENIDLVLSAYA